MIKHFLSSEASRKRLLVLVPAAMLALAAAVPAAAQIRIVDDPVVPVDTTRSKSKVYTAVEEAPKFPGGDAALYKWLSNNIRYPEQAVKNNVQGRVMLQFVVQSDGTIGQVKVVRGKDKDLDAEAVRLVKSMPVFSPGRMNGTPVNCWYTLPIIFKLPVP